MQTTDLLGIAETLISFASLLMRFVSAFRDTWTPTGWTCWCGNLRGGHICRQVMKERQDEILQREVFMMYSMLQTVD